MTSRVGQKKRWSYILLLNEMDHLSIFYYLKIEEMGMIRNVRREEIPKIKIRAKVRTSDHLRRMAETRRAEETLCVVESCYLDEKGEPVSEQVFEQHELENDMAVNMNVVDEMRPMTGAALMESTFLDGRKAFDLEAYLETFRKEGTFREDKQSEQPEDGQGDAGNEVVGDRAESSQPDDAGVDRGDLDTEHHLVLEHGCWYRDRSGCSIQVFKTDDVATELPEEVRARYPFCKQNGTDFFTAEGYHYGTVPDEDLVEKITPTMPGVSPI